jgi:Glycosyltransferase 61
MQQLYRCWSWWIANPNQKPVLVFSALEKTNKNGFFMEFLKVLEKEINLEIVLTHDGPYVQAKDTGMWDNDIEITDYAMFDPERKLRQIFAPYIPNIVPDPPCPQNYHKIHRLPRIAILNRAETSSRHLLNAKELATSLEDTFPGQTVPIVYFENKTMLEQVQFFMENDIVISPHGAQLTGIAFMKNCSTLIEFFPKNYLTVDYFASLAASVGVNHKFFYLGNNEEQIQSYERYHYILSAGFRKRNLCPNMRAVMSALVEEIQNWRPCCSVISSLSTKTVQQDDTNSLASKKVRSRVAQHPTIDIVSVGSLSRIVNHNTQTQTFGSHRFVRHFYPITEQNDTDQSCISELTSDLYQNIISSCRTVNGQSVTSKQFRTQLFRPMNNSTEWLCEQKRPIDGLHIALENYKNGASIPDYLMLIGDDTYLNMDALVKKFQESYPPDDNHLVAGCTYLGVEESHFVYPIGGMGSILTRATIEKIMQPIHCQNVDESTVNPFVQWACWRLNENLVGEARFFKDGMSVSDLMYAYASGLPFSKVDEWDETGYCFHSDHAIGYFFDYYHVSVPDWLLHETTPTDNIRKLFSFKKLSGSNEGGHSGRGGECENVYDKCSAEARICHFVDSEQMTTIYKQQQQLSSS